MYLQASVAVCFYVKISEVQMEFIGATEALVKRSIDVAQGVGYLKKYTFTQKVPTIVQLINLNLISNL